MRYNIMEDVYKVRKVKNKKTENSVSTVPFSLAMDNSFFIENAEAEENQPASNLSPPITDDFNIVLVHMSALNKKLQTEATDLKKINAQLKNNLELNLANHQQNQRQQEQLSQRLSVASVKIAAQSAENIKLKKQTDHNSGQMEALTEKQDKTNRAFNSQAQHLTDLQQENQNLSLKNASLNEFQSILQKTLEARNQDHLKAAKEISSLTQQLKNQDHQIQIKLNQVLTLSSELKALKTEVAFTSFHNEETTKKQNYTMTTLSEQNRDLNRKLQTAVFNLSEATTVFESERTQWQSGTATLAQQKQVLEKEKFEVENSRSQTLQNHAVLFRDLSKARQSSQEHNERLQIVINEKSELQNQVTRLQNKMLLSTEGHNRQVDLLKEVVAKEDHKTFDLVREKNLLTEQIEALKLNLSGKQMEAALIETRFENENSNLKQQMEILQRKLIHVESENDETKLRLDDQIQQTRIYSDRVSRYTAEFNQHQQQIQFKSAQLQRISTQVNADKKNILQVATQLLKEMQMSKKLNPLNDILKITSEEIDKLENQLKKTPVISFERPQLERYMDQLLEQRSFIKKSLEKVHQQTDVQVRSIFKIIYNEDLNPLPPVPELEA
ncbi:MAG: hypothetical protein H7Z71_07325 [Moraxellaceae bacterium]|nr:hypothetical protein [Pseudobdellovibrionaceae bacterium]